MTISFIIPVYNGSEYIVRCLDSITKLAIPEKYYEVIVVDDCSTDDTRNIVRDYMVSHNQVRLICQPENHRQGAARNRGLREASGMYIYYADADDEVMPGVVSALNFAIKNQLDVCYCGVEHQLKNGEFVPMRFNIPSPLLLSGKQLGEEYADEICTGPWAYLWRLEYLKKSIILLWKIFELKMPTT